MAWGSEAEAGYVQSACPGCLRRGDAGRPRYLGEFRTPLALIVANPWGFTRVWVVGFRFEKKAHPCVCVDDVFAGLRRLGGFLNTPAFFRGLALPFRL